MAARLALGRRNLSAVVHHIFREAGVRGIVASFINLFILRLKQMMKVLDLRHSQVTYPTGDPKFAVKQAFPAGFNEREADPFLMCDYFGPSLSTGKETDPDTYQVRWHPHRGMDILTYLKEGVGRHADSLGNRGEYATPGMQWISVGSGIEHAEGGGTPAGEYTTGFQIWVNVPAKDKMNDPRYGTEPPENIPTITDNGTTYRLLAGQAGIHRGPFNTVTDVLVMDVEVQPGHEFSHSLPPLLDNIILYAYKGAGSIMGREVVQGDVVRLDATLPDKRQFTLCSGSSQQLLGVMVFAGKRLNEPIAWHGPFVMNTQAEIQLAQQEHRLGTFLKRRCAWDYKRIATAPTDVSKKQSSCGI